MRRLQRRAPHRKPWFIGQAHECFMSNVYSKLDERAFKAMADLALENSLLMKSRTPTFMFEGVWYTSPWNAVINNRDAKEYDRALDPSLHERAVAIIHGDCYESKLTKQAIRQYIGDALTLCRTMGCLRNLLPDAVWKMDTEVEQVGHDTYTIGPPLSQDEIDNFKATHLKGSQACGLGMNGALPSLLWTLLCHHPSWK